MVPPWLTDLSVTYLCLGAACAILIVVDELRHPQHMWIMNVVWPVGALFGTLWVVRQYFHYSRLASREQAHAAMAQHLEPPQPATHSLLRHGRQWHVRRHLRLARLCLSDDRNRLRV